MNQSRIIIFIIIAIICSCNQNKSTELNKKAILIDFANSNKNIQNFTELIDSIAIIKIDSNIQRISSIDKVFYQKEKFFIFDKNLNSIFVLDDQGNLITKIGKKGLGPGEFTDLVDVSIDFEKDILYALDIDKDVIINYSLNGEFIDELKLTNQIYKFAFSQNTFALFSGYFSDDFHNLYLSNTNGKVYNSLFQFPKDKKLNKFQYTGNIIANDNGFLYTESTSSIIYEVDFNGNFYKRYVINFDENQWKEDEIYNHEDFLESIIKGEINFLRNNIYETNNYLFFDYNKSVTTTNLGTNNQKIAIYNKVDSTLFTHRSFENDFLYNLISGPKGLTKEGFYISILTHDYYDLYKDKYRFENKEILKTLDNHFKTTESNPIMLVYKLKS